ncbi:RNA-directed DNA polymerase, eukaryota, partial [Tanacetum coccineum]
LNCFSLASGLVINLKKSQILGVGVQDEFISDAATFLGCSILKTPFKYLGVSVGGNMSMVNAWEDSINKIKSRLSKWKINTLSIGGRLTLLKSVLGSAPIYCMSLHKVPKTVLYIMESLRRDFFNGCYGGDRKIAWVQWSKVLASKKNGGLGVASFYALNRALLFKWVWRFLSRDNSLWFQFISSMYGSNFQDHASVCSSIWGKIIKEVNVLKLHGVDLLAHCNLRVGSGHFTRFWKDVWVGDIQLCFLFPRLFMLEDNKDCTVADKLHGSLSDSFRRTVRGGVESSQLEALRGLIEGIELSSANDRWIWDLNNEGIYRVSDARSLLDDFFLPKSSIATRWVKYVPIKVNVFRWKLHLDRLPTRANLGRRGVQIDSLCCPVCTTEVEDVSHLFFQCTMARDIYGLVCRWWDIPCFSGCSYEEWISWFCGLRLGSRLKGLLEGVFSVMWWSIWSFRNQLLFSSQYPRKHILFDDIVICSTYNGVPEKGTNYGFIEWVDPLMCHRALDVIPGFLRARNELEEDFDEQCLLLWEKENLVKKLTTSLGSTSGTPSGLTFLLLLGFCFGNEHALLS